MHGRDRDLLVDTGLGHFSLRDHVALVSERPLVCVASHTYFDHIGCHHELGERCFHFADAAILADPRNEWTLADPYATDEMFDRFPEGWSAERYRIWLAPAQRPLADRDVVVLGDLSFQVYTRGHPPAAIGLFEQATGSILSGDIVYDGPLIDDAYHSDPDAYVAALETLRRLPISIVHG